MDDIKDILTTFKFSMIHDIYVVSYINTRYKFVSPISPDYPVSYVKTPISYDLIMVYMVFKP